MGIFEQMQEQAVQVQEEEKQKQKSTENGRKLVLAMLGILVVIAICVVVLSSKDDDKSILSATSQDKTAVSSVSNNGQRVSGETAQSGSNNEVPCVDNSHIISVFESSSDKEGRYIHNAAKAFDGSSQSCWTEGVHGNGIGEYIGAKFDGTQKISGLKIWIGHQKTKDLFYKNSVPTRIKVIAADGTYVSCELQDLTGEQTITFDTPLITNEVKLVVDDVREGNQWQDTCIAEVRFF